jgi:hypothetical protein
MTSPKMTDTVFFDILSDINLNVKQKIHSSIRESFESEEDRIKKDSIKAESFLFAMRNPLNNSVNRVISPIILETLYVECAEIFKK